MDTLIKAFAGLAETARSVRSLANDLPPEVRAISGFERRLDSMTQQMAATVVAVQFYDKLTQRLGYVRYSLSALALFVCNPAQSAERNQWRRLFTSLQRLYRTEEERRLFQLMLDGASALDAKTQLQQATEPPVSQTGEIELF